MERVDAVTAFDRANSQSGNPDASAQNIELGETETQVPPIYRNPTVITVQPYVGNSCRRPIPINTVDWVSTPRSQLNALSGMHFLAGVEQLEIQQIVDLNTLLGKSDRGNQYRVKVPRAESLFLAIEQRDKPHTLFDFGFTLNVLDQCGETAFVIKKDLRWTCFGRLHKITVESANLIGTVEENVSVLGPSFTAYDDAHNPLCNIYGPNVCGCCMYKEAQFQVLAIDGSHQMASLMHQWNHLIADYTFLLTFPVNTDAKVKSLLLGATFLLENLYFERIRRKSRK